MEQAQLKCDIDAFLYLKQENEKLKKVIHSLIQADISNMGRWRDAGLSLNAIRVLLSQYADPEDGISAGKVADELRGLAEAALEKRLLQIQGSCVCSRSDCK